MVLRWDDCARPGTNVSMQETTGGRPSHSHFFHQQPLQSTTLDPLPPFSRHSHPQFTILCVDPLPQFRRTELSNTLIWRGGSDLKEGRNADGRFVVFRVEFGGGLGEWGWEVS